LLKSTKPKAMKKITLFFVMISLLSGLSTAQLKMESFNWDPYHIKSYPFVILKKSPYEAGQLLTFEKEYSVVEVPELSTRNFYYFEAGPLLIVKFNSHEFELENLSKSNMDVNWIKRITVIKDSNAEELYGCRGRNGVVIIEFKENHGAKTYRLKDGRIVDFSNRIEECEPPYERKWIQ